MSDRTLYDELIALRGSSADINVIWCDTWLNRFEPIFDEESLPGTISDSPRRRPLAG